MSQVQTPNTNPILDPVWATAEAKRAFKAQLEVARDVCDYGSKLLMRVFSTGEQGVGGVVVLGLFRQFLAMLDTAVLGLENGAVYGTEPSLRAALEASWSLEWLLRCGGDHERRCFYVATVRDRRSWNRAVIKGTREHAALRKSGRHAAAVLKSAQKYVSAAREDLKEIRKLLQRTKYRKINAQFAKREKHYRPGRTVPWYELTRAKSPRMMARQLDREDEHAAMYRSYSATTHGAKLKPHMTVSNGLVTVEPIRLPNNEWGSTFVFAMGLAFKTYQVLIRSTRPDEEERFNNIYKERWQQAFINVPRVTVSVSSGPYGAN